MKFLGLVHEGLEAGQGVGLLLAIIGHIEDRDIAVFLSISFEKGAHNGPGHAGKGHDVDDPADPPLCEIDGLPNGEDRFSFKRGIDIRFCLLEERLGFRFTEVSESIFE